MKKILSLILVFIMALGTIGCAGGGSLSTGGGENGSVDVGSGGSDPASGNVSGSTTDPDASTGGVEDGEGGTEGGGTGGSSSSESEKYEKGELYLTNGVYKITEAKDTDAANITIDFGNKLGSQVQNTKKIDIFSPTWNFGYSEGLNQESLKTLEYLSQFKAEAFRFDMMFGGVDSSMTGALNSGAVTDAKSWAKIDAFANALRDNNVIPYFVMVGIPGYVQGSGQMGIPTSNYYTDFCVKATQYFKNSNRRVIYETWNEPDLGPSYWSSQDMQAFVDLNCKATYYFKQGNKDAYVAEGGLCWPLRTYSTYWSNWISQTNSYQNHIDALSWHFYGDNMGDLNYGMDSSYTIDKGNLQYYAQKVRDFMNGTSNYDFHTTTMHISEFAGAKTFGNKQTNEVQVSWLPKLYDTLRQLKDLPDVTRISYACWMLDIKEFTIIDPFLFVKNPVYNVLWSNGRLPLAPVAVTNSNTTDFYVNTGVDNHRAAAVILNKNLNTSNPLRNSLDGYISTGKNRNATVLFKNIPFNAKNAKIYLIDTQNVSRSTLDDKPYLIMDLPETQVKQGEMKFNFTIPENAAFHVEFSDGATDAKGELICDTDLESALYDHVVRKDYYYDDHRANMPWGDIYEVSQSVSLTMMNNNSGKAAVMVTYDDMNEFTNLKLNWDIWDLGTAQSNKGIGVRIDYHTSSGYTSPKYYYYGNYSNCFAYKYNQANANGYCWGTGTAPALSAGTSFGTELSGSYTIPLASSAPSGWDGRVQITYYMMDAGANANAILTMNAA
ncbi:MAG: cellulase family glycosylhydrolase [Clostridia bacterium]|nr:cellulase family glycosylhydrolase [Clostridia bacterium]